MKLDSNRLVVSEKNCFNILMGPQYERPRLIDQRSTLTFRTYLQPLSLDLTYQVKIMTGFNRI